jgi:raffinose/stachyose/melibiose transport system permease protein
VSNRRHAFLYLAPGAALVTLFLVGPMVALIYLGMTRWVGVGTPEFVGFANYRQLVEDPAFRQAVGNTIKWAAVGVFIHTPLCLLVALILSRQPRFWKFFRTVFFLPSVISTTAIAFLWYFILHVDLGMLNKVLELIGLGSLTRAWLFDPSTALISTQLPFIIYIGFGMVLLMTQISTIPAEVYEAAVLDGASTLRQEFSITIPLIRRGIALQCLFVIAYALRAFEYPFIMTSGGPGDRTTNLSFYIYRQMMTANQYGLAAAAGVVTLVLGAAMVAVVFVFLSRAERA